MTKSRSIVRDVDLLASLAERNLVHVHLSVTTLDHKLSNIMEPRASSPQRRLDAVRLLNRAGVPTGILMAPVIPAINDVEIETLSPERTIEIAQLYQLVHHEYCSRCKFR